METIQSVATIKCTLDHSVYTALNMFIGSKHTTVFHCERMGQTVKSHCRQFVMFNNVLSKLCSFLCYSMFGTLYKFMCSTFSVTTERLVTPYLEI